METFSALLALCAGNSPVPGEFPAQRPVTRSFDVFFDLHLNKRLSKQWWGWWFDTLSSPLWRHRNAGVNMILGPTSHGILWMYWLFCALIFVNTLRRWHNGCHFADDIVRRIFVNENYCILIQISPKYGPNGPIVNMPLLVQIMDWRRTGQVYWRIYASLGLNESNCINKRGPLLRYTSLIS